MPLKFMNLLLLLLFLIFFFRFLYIEFHIKCAETVTSSHFACQDCRIFMKCS